MTSGQPDVIGHFGSKAELWLGALEEAIACFRREVWDRAESAMPGRARMLAIGKARAIYIDLFLVGSFITATSFEFDDRARRVHDLIFDAAATWLKTLASEACTAIEPGELPARRDPTQITFELNPISIGAKLVSCTVIPAAPGAACIQ